MGLEEEGVEVLGGVAAPLRAHPLSKVHASHIYTPLADALCTLDAHALVNDQDVHQK